MRKSDKTMTYLDSNILIHAAIDQGKNGQDSRTFLTQIARGRKNAITSTTTIDELMWIVQKEEGKTFAAEVAKAILSLKNLRFIDLNLSILSEAINLYTQEKLNPRDSIHLATMRAAGTDTIISFDQDFDTVSGITRKTP